MSISAIRAVRRSQEQHYKYFTSRTYSRYNGFVCLILKHLEFGYVSKVRILDSFTLSVPDVPNAVSHVCVLPGSLVDKSTFAPTLQESFYSAEGQFCHGWPRQRHGAAT